MSVPAREVVASPRRATAAAPRFPHTIARRGASLFMAAALGFQLLGQAMPVAASESAPAPSAASAAMNDAAPGTITLVSGGGAGAIGSIDPSVTAKVNAAPVPVTIVTKNTAWNDPLVGSRWISATSATDTVVTYSTTFALPAGVTSPSLTVQVLADNAGTVSLNGHPIGGQVPIEVPRNYSIPGTYVDTTAGDFLQGTNTLTIDNRNFSGPEGLDFTAVVRWPAQDLVANGGFEDPAVTDSSGITSTMTTGLTGWTVTAGNVDLIGSHWAPARGNQSIDLAGSVPGEISQNLTTVAGTTYQLTFQYSANPDGDPATKIANVYVDGALVDTVTHPKLVTGVTSPSIAWYSETKNFTATTAVTPLVFQADPSSTAYGIALDDVSVIPVAAPVPAASPVLAVAASGLNGGIAGRVQGQSNGTETVSLFLSATCASGVPGATQALGHADLQLNVNGAALFAVNLANLPTGQYVVATASAAGYADSGFSNCVQVGASNDSWPNALDIGVAPNGDGSFGNVSNSAAPGYKIDQTGQSRWYKFTVAPGESVTVDLSSLPADYDAVLFKDITKAYTTLTSTSDLNTLGANFAGQAFSGQAFSGQAFSAQAFSPDAYSAQAFSGQAFSADVFSGQAFSAQAFSGQAFSAQAFSAQAFSGQAFSGQAFSGPAFSGQAFSPQAFSSALSFSDPSYSAQAFSTTTVSPQAFSGQAFSPQAFSSAQVQSVIAVSANPGTGPESITANTWNNTGEFYVRVTGKNGAFDPNTAFTLHVTQSLTSCAGVHDYGSAPAATPPGSIKTVILTDSDRIDGTADEKSTLATQLAALAARPEVAGAVVDVKSLTSTGRIHDLAAQAAANPTCPYAENLLASALKDIVDSYRTNNPTLAYVVLVGGDTTVPFFRYPDEALLAPESGYIPPVLDSSTSQAALQLNYVLSQDAYGAGIQINQNANTFPVPNLAVGRLVETAAEATTMVNAYLNGTTVGTGAVPTPTTSLVTGYDFLSDAASTVKTSLDTGTGHAGDALIAPNNISPTDPAAWNATQLKSSLLGSRHDLVFLAGHFSANSALAADFTTTIQTTDLAASNVNLTNSIVFSAGCHSGYNIVNGAVVPNITQPLDWSEAFAKKGATLIAGTGYQYGDTDFEMYSERIYAGFASQLLVGSGPVSVGQALVKSKQAYLSDTPTLRGIDTKALLEATLFGLPMLSVDLPAGGRTPAPTDTNTVSPSLVGSGPGNLLGLKAADLAVSDALTPNHVTFKNPDGTPGPTATWYSGTDGVASKPFEPTLPLVSKNVTVPGLSLRGVGFMGGTYTDSTITPLTGAATTDLRGVHTSFSSPVFYPMKMANANYFDALSGGATRLLVTPAQHQSTGPGSQTATLRLYSGLNLRLFYSSNIDAAALAAPPTILDVAGAQADANNIAINTHVVGDPTAGIHDVWITWTWSDGTWQSQDLAQDGTDSTHWSWNLPVGGHNVANLRFVIQAVNGVGLVGVNDNYGQYHKVTPTVVANPNTTSITFSGQSSGTYGTVAAITATLSGANGNSNQPITLSLGGATVFATTDGMGMATAHFQLSQTPAQYNLNATYGGDANNLASTATKKFTINKVATTLTMSGPGSAPIGSSSGLMATLMDANNLPVGLRTVWFVVTGNGTGWTTTGTTDYLGHASLGAIPLPAGDYTVTAYFDGTITLAPTSTVATITDSTYVDSSVVKPFSILLNPQTVTFGPLADRIYGDSDFTVSATASSGLTVTFTSQTTLVCTVTGSSVHLLSSGMCTIQASQVGDGTTWAAATPVSRPFNVSLQPATLTYTGNTLWSTGTGTSVAVTLAGQATGNGSANTDLTKASVDFLLFSSGNNTVTPNYTCHGTINSAGAVSCSMTLGVDSWTVVMRITPGNAYFAAPQSDPTIVSVYKPTAGRYAIGAGTVTDPGYQNLPVAISPSNTNGRFGFAVSYKTDGKTPQGGMTYVFHGVNGYNYRIVSTSWLGGALAFGTGVTTFTGRAWVLVIDPATGTLVPGLSGIGFTYRVDVKDGSPDKFAMSIRTSKGALYHQVGTPTNELPLLSGGILVH